MHLPVLLKETIEHLAPRSGNVVLDATLGGAGHSLEILNRISPGGRLIAVDRDPEAIERCMRRLAGFRDRIVYVNDDFRNVGDTLKEHAPGGIDGAVFDLGISSFQVDDAGRGFSFLKDGPLDMRFDQTRGCSAADAVNGLGKEDLADIIWKFGEERYSRRIASAICAERKKKRIETTGDLSGIIKSCVGGKYRRQRLHPAARTFQALRIYVNDELTGVETGVRDALFALRAGGRICVISFHSLEDRIVKNIFREAAKAGEAKIITKKPVRPSDAETSENPRSRSAKLRVAEKA